MCVCVCALCSVSRSWKNVGTRRATLFTHKCQRSHGRREERRKTAEQCLFHREWIIILILWKNNDGDVVQSDNCFLLRGSFKKTFPRKLKCYLNIWHDKPRKNTSVFQEGNGVFERNLPENISIYGSVSSLCHMLIFHFVNKLWLAGSRPQKEDIDISVFLQCHYFGNSGTVLE